MVSLSLLKDLNLIFILTSILGVSNIVLLIIEKRVFYSKILHRMEKVLMLNCSSSLQEWAKLNHDNFLFLNFKPLSSGLTLLHKVTVLSIYFFS